MSMFNNPIQEILANYQDYVVGGKDHTEEERVEYINKQFNQLSVIAKLISISSNGKSVESQISDPATSNTRNNTSPQPPVQETPTAPVEPEDAVSAEDIITEELNAWGVGTEYAGSRILLALTKLNDGTYGDISTDMEYDDLCNALALAAGTTSLQVKTNVTFIRKKANFNKTKNIPILRKLPRSKITNEIIMKELLEFVLG